MTLRNRRNRPVSHRDRRFWYGAAAVIIVLLLLLIGWALGWFTPSPEAPATG
jgi:hypothetical protein